MSAVVHGECDRGRSHRRYLDPVDCYHHHIDDASRYDHRDEHIERMAVSKSDYSRRRSQSESRHNLRVAEHNPWHSRSIAPSERRHHHDHEPHHHYDSHHHHEPQYRDLHRHEPSNHANTHSKAMEHAAEKAISAAAAAVFHLRQNQGSWIGGKGVKVAGAAAAAALIDVFLNPWPGHTIQGLAVSAFDMAVGDKIVNGSLLYKIL